MRRLSLLLLGWALGCAPVPPPPPPPIPPATAVAPPAPTPTASALPLAAPKAPAPVLPLHRFAAPVASGSARLFALSGRSMLEAGGRLYSLSPGEMHREAALEKALAGPSGSLSVGAIGGSYPDGLLADRQVRGPGKEASARQYVRLDHGKATPIALAQQDAGGTLSRRALQVVALPGQRLLARLDFDTGEQNNAGWLDFAGGPKTPREDAVQGVVNATPFGPLVLARADGSVLVVRARLTWSEEILRTLWWGPRVSEMKEVTAAFPAEEVPAQLFESTTGVVYLLTNKALHRQNGSEWQAVETGGPLQSAWPLPDGALLLVSRQGEPRVMDAHGAVTPARWPAVAIEGRRFEVSFTDAICTREAGFWAIAADGLGLFHDRTPAKLVDMSSPDAAGSAR